MRNYRSADQYNKFMLKFGWTKISFHRPQASDYRAKGMYAANITECSAAFAIAHA